MDCTCTLGNQCGPEGCDCTTSIMECAVHGDSEIGQLEKAAVERKLDEARAEFAQLRGMEDRLAAVRKLAGSLTRKAREGGTSPE